MIKGWVIRKHKLVTGQTYHIFTRSIAGYNIFNSINDYSRILEVIRYYQNCKPETKYSIFKKNCGIETTSAARDKLISIIAYCLMPTHIHLVLRQDKENGISKFLNNILNSYTRYFNIKHNRKGPLWEGRFKNIHIENDEYLLHLTRYIHLNPTTSNLAKEPQEWKHSSYNEYLNNGNITDPVCSYQDVLDIKPAEYKDFVEDRTSYQKELKKIKFLLLE